MSRDFMFEPSQSEETEYPSVPWPRSGETADGDASDGEGEGDAAPRTGWAAGVPRRKDHI